MRWSQVVRPATGAGAGQKPDSYQSDIREDGGWVANGGHKNCTYEGTTIDVNRAVLKNYSSLVRFLSGYLSQIFY